MAVIGPKLELTYPYQHAGEGAPALADALSGGADGLLVSSVSFLAQAFFFSVPFQSLLSPSRSVVVFVMLMQVLVDCIVVELNDGVFAYA